MPNKRFLLLAGFLLLLAGCAPFPEGPISGSLTLLNTIGATGADSLEFIPYDVAVASGGRMFVTDPGNGRILIFDSPGQVQGTSWNIPGMSSPEDIAIDGSGKIYVTSSNSNQIQV